MAVKGKPIIERKIKYDNTIVEHHCKLVKADQTEIILYHEINEPFSMMANGTEVTIHKGCYTIAYYWTDRPYNIYIWRNQDDEYVGAYFNIVKETSITADAVNFEDMIIDVLVLPNRAYFILDEEELPEALEQFEGGTVQQTLSTLLNSLDQILDEKIRESSNLVHHQKRPK
ncbi:DUF402 domain-containing protein [Evansella halocellulosilytica]|uniref:DUF402 domain-containing protein n=1 Tax=Evansella halocellulosilytica TaxID=2011013 RepID=UPI000BB7EC6F|nr:DUF402 domain-containing protein [Evansella halocellulosilytica]